MKQVTLAPPLEMVTVSLRLPVELHARLVQECNRRSTPVRKVTMTDVLRELIDKGC